MATTKTVKAENRTDNLSDAAIEELFEGAPASFSDAGEETEPVRLEPIDAPVMPLDNGAVLLTNIYFPEEEVLLPDPVTRTWQGEKVVFNGGRATTDPETAERVKAACPYVYQEDPNGHWMTHTEGKFRTTSVAGFEKFSKLFAER